LDEAQPEKSNLDGQAKKAAPGKDNQSTTKGRGRKQTSKSKV
jgi:hypothetical protein